MSISITDKNDKQTQCCELDFDALDDFEIDEDLYTDLDPDQMKLEEFQDRSSDASTSGHHYLTMDDTMVHELELVEPQNGQKSVGYSDSSECSYNL